MRLYHIFLTLFLLPLFIACKREQKPEVDVSGVPVNLKLIRFDQRFYEGGPENLDQLKAEFPYLFPQPNPDSIWTSKMQDEDERYLFKESQEEFGEFSEQEEDLRSLFRHLKYYFPDFREPKVITVISNVDYDNKVILADSLLFLSLDMYLGADHEVYQAFPAYVKQNYNPANMLADVAESYAERIVPPADANSFVSRMVREGKKLRLMQALMPEASKELIMGYTEEQWEWSMVSESEIWKYFIQNEMLYSTENDLTTRFIEDAPFSKFYLEVDKDSPGRIGAWFGWQIVEAYMKNTDSGLLDMLREDNEAVFRKSKYKPRKM